MLLTFVSEDSTWISARFSCGFSKIYVRLLQIWHLSTSFPFWAFTVVCTEWKEKPQSSSTLCAFKPRVGDKVGFAVGKFVGNIEGDKVGVTKKHAMHQLSWMVLYRLVSVLVLWLVLQMPKTSLDITWKKQIVKVAASCGWKQRMQYLWHVSDFQTLSWW